MMRKIPARLYFGFIVISVIGLTVAAQGIYQLSGIEQQRLRIAGFTASLSRNEETSFNLETILRKEARTRSERDEGTWVELKDLEQQVSSQLTAAMATLSSYRRQLYQSVIQAMNAHDESLGRFKQQQDASAIYRGKLALEGDGLVAAMDKLVAGAAGEAETTLAAKAEAAILMLQVTNLRFQTIPNHAGPESFRASLENAGRSLASLSDAANGANKAMVAEVQARLRAYAADFAVFAEAYLNSTAIYDQQLSPQVAAMQKNLKSAEASLKTAVAAATADSESLIASATLISEILASGGFMLSLLLAFLIGRSISRPLNTMTTAMTRLAGQDMGVNVPGIGRRDEIGTMAKAVQLFKEAGLEKRRLEAAAIAQAETVEAERARVEVERATYAKQQSIVVEELAKGLAYLAGGDLTYILAHEFAPDYERLRNDFNAAVRELHQAICAVVTSTRSISQETGRVAEAAEKLSARTDGHAVSLQGTVKALGEITATIRKTAQGAMRASLVVARTKTDAEQSGEVVRQAIGAMATIEQSSSQISQIIGVIDEIAFQTNLLALNAGVEAARAGDSGRGFAVVASEVRALAQRSAQAAKEIKALISTSSGQVDMGVQLVGKAGQALARIVTQVVEITEAVSEMAVAAQQQSAGLNEVFSGVSEMEKLTHENASMVAESTAANQALARETVELVRLAERFRIDDQDEAPDNEHGGTARRVA